MFEISSTVGKFGCHGIETRYHGDVSAESGQGPLASRDAFGPTGLKSNAFWPGKMTWII